MRRAPTCPTLSGDAAHHHLPPRATPHLPTHLLRRGAYPAHLLSWRRLPSPLRRPPSRGAGLPPSCATPLSSSRRRASPLPHRRAAPLPRGATSLLAASLPPRAAAPVTPPPPTDPVDPRDHRRDGAPSTPPSRRILAPSNRAEPGTHGSSRASCLRPSSLLDPGRILLRRRAPSPAAPPHPDPVNLQPVPTITRSLELAGGSSPGPSSSRQRARSRGEDIPCFPASSTNHGNVCGG
nr:vegetative cell wall protein gp1 [Aegilops tauschii subsp. strangulata]